MIKARRGTLRVPEYDPYFADHLPPVPDLLQRLSWEHRQIEKLWNDLQRLHRHDGLTPQSRLGGDTEAGVGQQLSQALTDHGAAELQALHPAASRVMTPEWADQAAAEHAELLAALDEIDGRDAADEAVFEIFQMVMGRVLAHINEQEQIVFPAMRVASPSEDLVNPEGYDFLGLPPGRTMIQATPGQRRRALGTGRRPNVHQMALDPGSSPVKVDARPEAAAKARGRGRVKAPASARPAAGAEPGTEPGTEPEPEPEPSVEGPSEAGSNDRAQTEIDLRDRADGSANAGDGDAAANGGTGDEATGTTQTRIKRLLRRH